jgi:hypothetical protein
MKGTKIFQQVLQFLEKFLSYVFQQNIVKGRSRVEQDDIGLRGTYQCLTSMLLGL